MLNEELYTTPSSAAVDLFEKVGPFIPVSILVGPFISMSTLVGPFIPVSKCLFIFGTKIGPLISHRSIDFTSVH